MRAPWGVLLLTMLVGAIVLAPAGTASGRGGTPTTIKIKTHGQNLFFKVPDGGVQSGSDLRIVNKTNPRQIGPHTFSLVVPKDIPKTQQDERDCFHGHHICRRVAKAWHQFDFSVNPPEPAVNPVDPGADGWDQEGRLDPSRKGDSFFFDSEGEKHAEVVSAAPGTVLHFMCIVHPFMHGHIEVK